MRSKQRWLRSDLYVEFEHKLAGRIISVDAVFLLQSHFPEAMIFGSNEFEPCYIILLLYSMFCAANGLSHILKIIHHNLFDSAVFDSFRFFLVLCRISFVMIFFLIISCPVVNTYAGVS